MGALLDRGVLTGYDGVHRPEEALRDRPASYGRDIRYEVTDSGRAQLRELGVDTGRLPPRRPAVLYCVDWSEDLHHLAGGLGAAPTARLFALEWVRWGAAPRVVQLTDEGATGLERALGLTLAR
ncbi:hypothetical protein ACFV9W_00760 [Streptomyces sp. NPDC059897]|uniref:hypothetical protein n=1 Tax=Streptomyces sp. NPDC059897 TaxID=3346994 RepID=UPI003652E861